MEHGSRPRSGPDQHQPRGLSSRAAIGLAVVLVVSGLTSYLSWTATYDYSDDAGPPIDALIHGRIHEFLTAHAVMGPLSMIVLLPGSRLRSGAHTGFFPTFHASADRKRTSVRIHPRATAAVAGGR